MFRELMVSLSLASTPVTNVDYLPQDTLDLSSTQLEEMLFVETQCLAENVYFEARNQGTAGKLAVIAVTLNRVDDERFPDTICGVVYEGQHKPSWKDPSRLVPVRHRCQFSWYCDGLPDTISNKEEFQKIYDLTYEIVFGNIDLIDITDGATHYHADYVLPAWAATKTKTIEIEDHIFYRWEKNR